MEQKKAKRYEKFLFTTSKPDETVQRCAIVLNHKFAVSFQHGAHSSLKKGDKLLLFNVTDAKLMMEVAVCVVSQPNDVIIFKAINGDFPEFPPRTSPTYIGEKYLQLGVDQKRDPVWKEGMVSKSCMGHYLGISNGEYVEPGCGIFDTDGRFIGMSAAEMNVDLANLPLSNSKVDPGSMADDHYGTEIISADGILSFLSAEDSDMTNGLSTNGGQSKCGTETYSPTCLQCDDKFSSIENGAGFR